MFSWFAGWHSEASSGAGIGDGVDCPGNRFVTGCRRAGAWAGLVGCGVGVAAIGDGVGLDFWVGTI